MKINDYKHPNLKVISCNKNEDQFVIITSLMDKFNIFKSKNSSHVHGIFLS